MKKCIKVWKIIAIMAFIFILISLYLAFNPIRLGQGDAINQSSEGKSFLSERDSDFLLLVSEKKITEEGNFYSRDWSYAWVNTLMQEAGAFSVMDADKPLELKGRVVIVSKSALSMPAELRNEIKKFTENGGILVIEEPTADWDFVSDIENRKSAEVQNRSILWGDFGKGSVIMLNFNYGLYLTSMQQGTPNSDYSVSNRYGRPDMSDTQELVLNREMLDNPVPYADIMERTIFNIIENQKPVPRLWYFPGNYSGAVIVSHDEDFYGDATTYLFDYEDSINATATFFIVAESEITKEAVERMGKNADIGLHWDKNKGFSIWKFRPFRFDTGLSRQAAQMQSKTPQKIIANRLHYLDWGDDYTKTFRNLHLAGFEIDSSYGPNIGRGYLFGTGQPFYALDKNGLVITVLEMPFQTQETWGGVDEEYMELLIRESSERYHEVIISNYHPHYSTEGGNSRALLEKNFELAGKYSQWITNFREYGEYLKKRNDVSMMSVFNGGKLIISEDSAYETTVIVPYEYSGLKVLKIEVNEDVAEFSKVSVEGAEYALIKIPSGRNKIVVGYG